jgi:hypothetical protein
VAEEKVSLSWVDKFIKRNQVHLTSKWTTGIDRTRHLADSGVKYKQYFDLLHQKQQEYSIEPRDIYNMDEKGFLCGLLGRSKRVFSRRMYEKGEVKETIQDGSRTFLTLLACICADGSALPPALIFPSPSGNIRANWVEEISSDSLQIMVTTSSNGWSNNDIGLAWLEQVFDRYTRPTRRRWRLLILDGHSSHVSMEFIDYCHLHRILLLVFPPHSTHTLQPLDVVMFKPLSSAYQQALTDYLHRT